MEVCYVLEQTGSLTENNNKDVTRTDRQTVLFTDKRYYMSLLPDYKENRAINVHDAGQTDRQTDFDEARM